MDGVTPEGGGGGGGNHGFWGPGESTTGVERPIHADGRDVHLGAATGRKLGTEIGKDHAWGPCWGLSPSPTWGKGILPGRRAWLGYGVQWDSGCSRSECWGAASWASAAPGSAGKGWLELK